MLVSLAIKKFTEESHPLLASTNMLISLQSTITGYLKVCTFFCLITQLSAMASACLVGLGARFRGLKRTRCLRFSICSTLVTFFCDITLIIVYTSQFAKEIDKSNREVWELNGAFGLACGVAILALGSLILLIFALRRTTSTYIDPTRV